MFAGWKQKKKHREALQSVLREREVDAANGPLSGPILHLRQRGDAARGGAIWLLRALFVAVVFGLAFYLGQPFWKQWADGRRSTLTENISATEQVLAGFDHERKKLQEHLVNEVIDLLATWGHADVTLAGGESESVEFRLPTALLDEPI